MIRLDNLTKIFGPPESGVVAADHITMEVPEGEICILLGPSGCGKTTTMKMVNRLVQPTSGKIYINGRDTDAYDAIELRRTIGYVIQQIGLFPNMTVEENICVVPDLLGWDKAKSKRRAAELLEMVALDPAVFLKRYPHQLSGGQQQRVALARALVYSPGVLLLDEPLSNLDAKLRELARAWVKELQQTLGLTTIFVTHDQDEALSLATRIAVINKGQIAQIAGCSDLYEFPANRFVADFIGSVNIFDGRMVVDEPEKAVIDCPEIGRILLNHGVTGPHNADLWVAIRPEKMTMSKPGKAKAKDSPDGANQADGIIRGMSYLGDITIYEVELPGGRRIRVSRPNLSRTDQDSFTWNEPVSMHWHPSSPVVLLA